MVFPWRIPVDAARAMSKRYRVVVVEASSA
jgi:hypothetical protein